MEFRNHSPFPAVAFGGVDTLGQDFHVIVLRQTLTWADDGVLRIADVQTPLCEVDEFFDAPQGGSPRYESDFCPYKPKCDVLLNGTAYPPASTSGPLHGFEAMLAVRRPDRPAPLPERPTGLNPTMPASREALARWEADVRHARAHPIAGERLIDKRLMVRARGHFQRFQGDAGNGRSWQLVRASASEATSVRLEAAFGGECRIDASDAAAAHVAPRHRLTEVQRREHPDGQADPASLRGPGVPSGPGAPLAHEALSANTWGAGFVTPWFLRATDATRVPAPRLEFRDRPLTAQLFDDLLAGRADAAAVGIATFGVRPKCSPERVALAGTIDEAFIKGEAPLPPDHDFAVWQAAWPDQQVDALAGNEEIALVNLQPPGEPWERMDGQGNRVLHLKLPGHTAHVTLRLRSGEVFVHPMRLDTVAIDTDQRSVICVWRAVLDKRDDIQIRVAEVGTMDAQRNARFNRERDAYLTLLDIHAATQAQPTEVGSDG
ncbi:DUF2169 domain-containing protein [Roseateles chitinivorans]|uniref:DUF2169 domain-containing protein n=1 Tax=Roseateles chitinivorans TaxID=2917965 RepID=UPI003D663CFE